MNNAMKQALVLLLLCITATATAQTTWYGWDQTLGLVAYDADTGAKNDLPGPGQYNLCLALDPVTGELWGFNEQTLYAIDRTDGTFVTLGPVGGIGYVEACSFDLAGNFLISDGSSLYQVNLATAEATFVRALTIQPDGFDVLPDGRWVANDTNTIYVLDSDWNVLEQWGGPANETIAADETGRVFGSNGNDLHEIDIVGQTSTLLWTDPAASALYGSEATSGDVEAQALARFRVTKTFSDGRDDEVEVTLTCNSGLPLEQSFTIEGGGAGVLFVVTELQGTDTVCEVTESGGPAGYTPVLNGGEGCSWEGVTGGLFTCEITNEADPAEFTVTKEWVIEGAVRDEVIEEAQVAINCSSDILSIDGDEITEPDGSVWVNLSGDGDSVTVTVDTTLGSTSCSAYEDVNQSGIETAYTAECGNGQVVVELVAGGSTSCTITNTVFFEGIPTLSQYGMALMALLMLGLGFVGLRRFV